MVSSANWSGDGVLRNRDAGLIIQDKEIAGYYQDVFLADWENRASAFLEDDHRRGRGRCGRNPQEWCGCLGATTTVDEFALDQTTTLARYSIYHLAGMARALSRGGGGLMDRTVSSPAIIGYDLDQAVRSQLEKGDLCAVDGLAVFEGCIILGTVARRRPTNRASRTIPELCSQVPNTSVSASGASSSGGRTTSSRTRSTPICPSRSVSIRPSSIGTTTPRSSW